MNRNNPRYEVKGKLWFGNKYFYEEITVSDDRENGAKEKFLQELKKRIKSPKGVEFQNFNLLLNKYVPVIKARILENRREKPWFDFNGESIGGDSKKYFLEAIIESFKVKYFRNYINEIKKMLENQSYKEVICKIFTTKSRLVVGLGSSHVLETALTLHHIYGIPYIPGSALKGACRAVAFWKLTEKKAKDKNKDLPNLSRKELEDLSEKFYGKLIENDNDILTYQLLFGAQDFKGLLLFLDAYPDISKDTDIFELDIMNVHYPGYYADSSGRTAPGDWENPRPIYFLTVKPDVNFNICVLFDEFRWDKLKELEKFKNKNDVINKVEKLISNANFLNEILQKALNEFGLGAKGRLGYGILE